MFLLVFTFFFLGKKIVFKLLLIFITVLQQNKGKVIIWSLKKEVIIMDPLKKNIVIDVF